MIIKANKDFKYKVNSTNLDRELYMDLLAGKEVEVAKLPSGLDGLVTVKKNNTKKERIKNGL